MARRFLSTYGPPAPEEFGRWFRMQPHPAKQIFKELGDEIEPVDVEGWKAWALVSSRQQIEQAEATSAVRLVPGFDPYTIAVYRHRQTRLPEKYKARVYRQAGWISAVVLVGGRMVGVWEYKKKRSRTDVKVKLFEKVDEAIKTGIEAEAQRIGKFFNSPVDVSYDG
jgi:uncharacterized protein YcaQ